MADNGNREPNDFRSRGGKKRREPPIIDASATEVPAESAELTPDGSAPPAVDVTAPAGTDAAEPVLFGSAMRDPIARSGGANESLSAQGADIPGAAVGTSVGGQSAESIDDPPALAAGGGAPPEPPRGAATTAARPLARPVGGGLLWLLSLAILALLGTLVWLLVTEPRRNGRAGLAAAMADLKTKVAALEARPDPSGLQNGVAALDKRVAAADADRAALAKTVAGLTPRLDAVAQQAEGAKAAADSAAATAKVVENAKPTGGASAPAFATLGVVAALSAKLDGLDKRLSGLDTGLNTLSGDQRRTAKAVADLPKPVAPDFGPVDARVAGLESGLTAVSSKLNGTDSRMNAFDAKVNAINANINGINATINSLGAAVNSLDANVNGFNSKVNGIDAKFNGFDTKMNSFNVGMNGLATKVESVDAKVNVLGSKLDGVDARFNGFDAKLHDSDAKMNGFDGRMNGIESKVDSVGSRIATLQTTVSDLPKVDLGPLQSATASLEKRVEKVESQLSAPKNGSRVTEARAVGSADETKATPIALVGQSIERAVADGRSYAADLDALKALGAEPDVVAKLAPLAGTGAPTVAALKERWNAVQDGVLAAVKPAETGGALDRFASSARALVRVRRVGAVQGGNPAAIVSQIDVALGGGDVAGALADWDKLPEAGKEQSRDWAAMARGRVDAATAARNLVARAIATLGQTKP